MRRARALATLATLAALAAFGAAASAGCNSPCGELASRICNCNPVGPLRDNCNNLVSNQLSQSPSPGTADENYCQSLLATCPDPGNDPTVCNRIKTQQGKIDCGLAFPFPDGGVDGGI